MTDGNPLDRYDPDAITKAIYDALVKHTTNIDQHYYRAAYESISCDSVGELAAQITPAALVAVLRAAGRHLVDDGFGAGEVLTEHADEIAADYAAADAWFNSPTTREDSR